MLLGNYLDGPRRVHGEGEKRFKHPVWIREETGF